MSGIGDAILRKQGLNPDGTSKVMDATNHPDLPPVGNGTNPTPSPTPPPTQMPITDKPSGFDISEIWDNYKYWIMGGVALVTIGGIVLYIHNKK